MKTRLLIIAITLLLPMQMISAQPIPEPEPVCKEGTILKNGACVNALGPVCGEGTTYQDGICVVDKIENTTEISTDPSKRWDSFASNYNIKSPLKQFKSGITIDEIQCKDNLILIQKYDGSPVCVKPETIPKLIERNWTTQSIVHEIVFKTMSKRLGPECEQDTMEGILSGIVGEECGKFMDELASKHQSEMIEKGYSFDQERTVWVKVGYPDVLVSIADYYQQNLKIIESTLDPESKPETMSEGIPSKKFLSIPEESFEGVFGTPITESEFDDVINYEPVKLYDLSEIEFNEQKLVLFEIRITANTDIHYLYAPQTMKLDELKNKQDFFDSGGILVKTAYLTNPIGVYQRLANDPGFEIEYLGTVPIRYHLYEEYNSLLLYPENKRLVSIQTVEDIDKIKKLASGMKLKNDSLNLGDYVMINWQLEEPQPPRTP